ncbi:MAG: DNA polymerase III subunit gamma/tau, partial [Bacteriovoracaceae bacterium]
GASNNSVDNIRELIENAQYLPSSGKYKVYVVDEVHMLSTSAFNALLKTLEEPPAHVIFIFATTDPHKLLGTVLSRCQRFDFKHVSEELLIEHSKKIAALENISFESEDSLKLLARQGNGSVRDTLSLMDQTLSLSAGGSISEETVLQSLGLARADSVKELVSCLLAENEKEALKVFDEISMDNVELEKLSNQLLDKLFFIIENIDNPEAIKDLAPSEEAAASLNPAEVMWMYEVLLKDIEWALQSFDPLRTMRFSLLKVCKRESIVGEVKSDSKKKSNHNVNAALEKKPEPAASLQDSAPKPNSPKKEEPKTWEGFLKSLYKENSGIAMNLERARLMTKPARNMENILLAFTEEDKIFYDFLNQPENLKKLRVLAGAYFPGEGDGPSLTFKFIDQETKEKENLHSNVELEEKKISDLKLSKEKELRANKFIKEAETLFSGEVSKIILNED